MRPLLGPIIADLCSISTWFLLLVVVAATCSKRKSISKEKGALVLAPHTDNDKKEDKQDRLCSKDRTIEPTQPEEEKVEKAEKAEKEQQVQPTQASERKSMRKKGTIIGYKSAGPDDRAFTIIMPLAENKSKSLELLDPLDGEKGSKEKESASNTRANIQNSKEPDIAQQTQVTEKSFASQAFKEQNTQKDAAPMAATNNVVNEQDTQTGIELSGTALNETEPVRALTKV
ncbi:hypothetical protein Q1695_008332 [Nippostrongylus brasiliensis]|nr:hypothetical protein Q1695_008332 [Nippostrongylus brasiliensis]